MIQTVFRLLKNLNGFNQLHPGKSFFCTPEKAHYFMESSPICLYDIFCLFSPLWYSAISHFTFDLNIVCTTFTILSKNKLIPFIYRPIHFAYLHLITCRRPLGKSVALIRKEIKLVGTSLVCPQTKSTRYLIPRTN